MHPDRTTVGSAGKTDVTVFVIEKPCGNGSGILSREWGSIRNTRTTAGPFWQGGHVDGYGKSEPQSAVDKSLVHRTDSLGCTGIDADFPQSTVDVQGIEVVLKEKTNGAHGSGLWKTMERT